MVARERGLPPDELLARWRTGSAALRDALAAADPHQRVDWVAGRLSVRTLATTRLAECWIHTGDVAAAVGATEEPSDRLEHIARLAWRTLPYAFARDGRELERSGGVRSPAPRAVRGGTSCPTEEPVTVIEGSGYELCLVAARRRAPDETSLHGTGPDVDSVLELVRTYA